MVKLELKLPPGYNRISKLAPLIQVNVLKALEDGMIHAEDVVKSKYLTGPRPSKLGVVTGLLKRKVASSVIRMKGRYFAAGLLGVEDVPYAAIHELGGKTRPHIIEARSAPFLVFYWKKNKIWMRIKKVNHPGSKFRKRPYLRPGLKEASPHIMTLLQTAIDNAHGAT